MNVWQKTERGDYTFAIADDDGVVISWIDDVPAYEAYSESVELSAAAFIAWAHFTDTEGQQGIEQTRNARMWIESEIGHKLPLCGWNAALGRT